MLHIQHSRQLSLIVLTLAFFATSEVANGQTPTKPYEVDISISLPGTATKTPSAIAGIDDCPKNAILSGTTFTLCDDPNTTTPHPNGIRTWIPAGGFAPIVLETPPPPAGAAHGFVLLDAQTNGYVQAREALALSAELLQRGLKVPPPPYTPATETLRVQFAFPVSPATTITCESNTLQIPLDSKIFPPDPTTKIPTLNIPLPSPSTSSLTKQEKEDLLLQQSASYKLAEEILVMSECLYLEAF